MDPRTRMILFKLLNRGFIRRLTAAFPQGKRQTFTTVPDAVETEKMRKGEVYFLIIERSKFTRRASWFSRTGTSMSAGSSGSGRAMAGRTRGRWFRRGRRRR